MTKSRPSFDLGVLRAPAVTWLLPRGEMGKVTWSAERYTTEAMEAWIDDLAVSLIRHEATPNPKQRINGSRRHVIVASEDPLCVLIGCLAVWRSGGVVVLPNNLKPQTLEDLAQTPWSNAEATAAPTLILRDRDVADRVLTRADASAIGGEHRETLASTLAGDQVVLVCFTSGSTGRPQAHEKRADQILGEARLLGEMFMADLGAPIASSVPAYHLYGVLFATLAPWLAGLPLLGAISLSNDQCVTPPPLRTFVSLGGARALVSVPAHLNTLYSTDLDFFQSVRRVFSSAAPLPTELGRGIVRSESPPDLVEAWGSTETGGVATRFNDPGGTWRPLPPISVAADSETRLRIRSPFSPNGMDRDYSTADKVKLIDGGFVHLGRDDGVIKVGGKRIALQDLENCAMTHPHVSDAVAVSLPAPGLRNQMVALAVASTNEALHERDILAHLSKRFDAVVLPRKLRIVPHIERSKTGKVQRDQLLSLFSASHPSATDAKGDDLDAMTPPSNAPTLQSFSEQQSFSQSGSPAETRSATEQLAGYLKQRGFVAVECAGAQGPGIVTFRARAPVGQIWFEGHFPGASVLPGVVQLQQLVYQAARIFWPHLGHLKSLGKIKFKRPLTPGDQVEVRLELRPAKNAVGFVVSWLKSEATEPHRLVQVLPHVFAQPAPAEASSGVLNFDGVQA